MTPKRPSSLNITGLPCLGSGGSDQDQISPAQTVVHSVCWPEIESYLSYTSVEVSMVSRVSYFNPVKSCLYSTTDVRRHGINPISEMV